LGDEQSREDVLLAVALGSSAFSERRILLDRRAGIERRRVPVVVAVEQRSGADRRLVIRRQDDRAEGATLLQKAQTRLQFEAESTDGLR
jgi:hypothetical protein